jgi:hypothetical protein
LTTAADAFGGDPGWLLMLTGQGDVYFSHLAVDERGSALVAAVFEQTASLGPKHQVTAVGGSDSHNFLVARMDPDGAVQWVVTGHGGPVAGLAADGTGGAYVVLGASKEVTFVDQHLTGLPIGAVVVARLSTSGKVVWAVASGGDDGALGWTDVVGPPRRCGRSPAGRRYRQQPVRGQDRQRGPRRALSGRRVPDSSRTAPPFP